MSGVAHLTNIFDTYSKFDLEETQSGTPICVFRKQDAAPTVYASGNGFAMSGGPGVIAHDYQSLDTFIETAKGALGNVTPANMTIWENAREKLAEKLREKNFQPQKLRA